MIDFSKDHKFKLNGDNISQFKVEIDIKTSTTLWKKSKKIQKQSVFLKFMNFIADKTLCKLSIGPGEDGNAGCQWKKMVDNPDEHSFSWHNVDFL